MYIFLILFVYKNVLPFKQVRYITLLIRTTIIFKEVTSTYSILILYHAYKLSEL